MTYTAEQFTEAIRDTGGIVSVIARRVGCAWHTAKKYIDDHPTVHQAWQDECEAVLDLAESKLITAIKNDDLSAVKYILSTKGKDRGYSERHEHSGPGGGAIPVQVFDHGSAVAALAARSARYRDPPGEDEGGSDGAEVG